MQFRFAHFGVLWILLFGVLGTVPAAGLRAEPAVQKVVLYGEEDNHPYAFMQNGRMQGLYAQILRRASAQMPGFEILFAGVPFKRGIDMLEHGEIMGFFPPYFRKNRTTIERYSLPILSESVVVVCRDGFITHRGKMAYPQGFVGATFGNNAGYRLPGKKFFELVRRGEITLEEANTSEINLRRLLAGRIDCYVNERRAIRAAFRQLGVTSAAKYHISEVAEVSHENGYVAYGPDPHHHWPFRNRFADELDTVLARMSKTGEIDSLVNRFFGS
jgi:polar amino acid transport system substrate-binding protein